MMKTHCHFPLLLCHHKEVELGGDEMAFFGVLSSIQGLVNDSLVLHLSLTIVKRQALGS